MRKVLLAAAGVVPLVLALVGWYALKPPSPSSRISVEGFERIQDGMRLEEVEEVIGLPPGDYRDGAAEAAGGGPPARREPPEENTIRVYTWQGEERTIRVAVCSEAGVIGKGMQAHTPERRGPVEALKAWLRR
jgi:hypothetical protein